MQTAPSKGLKNKLPCTQSFWIVRGGEEKKKKKKGINMALLKTPKNVTGHHKQLEARLKKDRTTCESYTFRHKGVAEAQSE